MNVLIIGDGSAGKRHAGHLIDKGHAIRIVGPADTGTDYFDACVIATPPEWHKTHLENIYRHDVHILCEGPMTIPPRLHPTSVRMMASNWRFVEELQDCKAYLNKNQAVNAHFWFDYDLRLWRKDVDMTRTCYYYCGHDMINVHEVDLALWLFGPAERVHVERIYTGKSKACDGFSMLIKHKRGVLTTIQSSWHAEEYKRGYNIIFSGGAQLRQEWFSPNDDSTVNQSYETMLDHWLQAIKDLNTNVEPSFADGWAAYQALQGVTI